MNYIDRIAVRIHAYAEPSKELADGMLSLYRIYAVLALAKGESTSDADVHDAWAAWTATHDDPGHRSLVEFYDLPPDIRALDKPYTTAIHAVARELWLNSRGGNTAEDAPPPPAATEWPR